MIAIARIMHDILINDLLYFPIRCDRISIRKQSIPSLVPFSASSGHRLAPKPKLYISLNFQTFGRRHKPDSNDGSHLPFYYVHKPHTTQTAIFIGFHSQPTAAPSQWESNGKGDGWLFNKERIKRERLTTIWRWVQVCSEGNHYVERTNLRV